jgi:hypothetical protein
MTWRRRKGRMELVDGGGNPGSGSDLDRGAGWDQAPDLLDLVVGDLDAAAGPVAEAMERAAWRPGDIIRPAA